MYRSILRGSGRACSKDCTISSRSGSTVVAVVAAVVTVVAVVVVVVVVVAVVAVVAAAAAGVVVVVVRRRQELLIPHTTTAAATSTSIAPMTITTYCDAAERARLARVPSSVTGEEIAQYAIVMSMK